MDHVARYLPTIKTLAQRALDVAVDASPTKPRQGEFVRSLMLGVPAAQRLLGCADSSADQAVLALKQASETHAPKFVDGVGHARLVYHYLLLDLVCRAECAGLLIDPPRSDEQVHHEALRDLCEHRAARRPLAESFSGEGALHEQTAADAPEAWVYREMVALHGLVGMFCLHGGAALALRVRSAAVYHLHHTQPDYTTYQPWGLAAFLWFPETVSFAEQQLHDVQTHLSLAGPAGALVPGLLLADAYATLGELREKS